MLPETVAGDGLQLLGEPEVVMSARWRGVPHEARQPGQCCRRVFARPIAPAQNLNREAVAQVVNSRRVLVVIQNARRTTDLTPNSAECLSRK